MPDDLEIDFNVTIRGQGPSEVVPVRLDAAMKAAVEARAA